MENNKTDTIRQLNDELRQNLMSENCFLTE